LEKGSLTTRKGKKKEKLPEGTNRMPADSTFYDKILPILLVFLAAITILLIVVAVGIFLGIVPLN
jgi:hypothetical protein